MPKRQDTTLEVVGKNSVGALLVAALKAASGQGDIAESAIESIGAAAVVNVAGRSVKRTVGYLLLEIGQIIGSDRLVEAVKTENGEDVIAMLFNSAMDCPDAAAKPAIIALGAEYLQHGTAIDRFIRCAMRMLVVCDADDIEMLARISHKASSVATDAYVKMLRYADKRGSISMFSDSAGGSTIPQGKSLVLDDVDADRAFYLISGNGLGRATTIYTSAKIKWAGTPGGPDAVVMPSEYVLRLAKILR